jgi:hypothetical protein
MLWNNKLECLFLGCGEGLGRSCWQRILLLGKLLFFIGANIWLEYKCLQQQNVLAYYSNFCHQNVFVAFVNVVSSLRKVFHRLISFWYFVKYDRCLGASLSHQPDISSTCHFINLPFCQLVAVSACHIVKTVNLFNQHAISSTLHFINL